jgi:hypothetical protein
MPLWLKITLSTIAGLISMAMLAVGVVWLVQPDHFRITRTRTLAAPKEAVRAQLVDLRRIEAWQARNEDPTDPPTLTFSDPARGQGAWVERTYRKSSNRLTVSAVTDDRIELSALGEGSLGAGRSTVTFGLRQAGATSTEVEYTIEGELNGVPRLFWAGLHVEARFGVDMDTALMNLERASTPASP